MITGAIIAGGKSTRMGFDKRILSMTQNNILKLRWICDDFLVVTDRPGFFPGLKTFNDVYMGVGPLSGIHSAIKNSKTEWICAIPCDMPYVNMDYIKFLISKSEGYDAVVTRRGKYIEPFMGLYSKRALNVIEKDVSQGLGSVQKGLAKLNTLYIPEELALSFSPDWKMFRNLNTRMDLEVYLNERI